MIQITRCICTERSFEELKLVARAHKCDFEELRKRTGCGAACGLCAPYVKAMLRTGKTEFNELIDSRADDGAQRLGAS